MGDQGFGFDKFKMLAGAVLSSSKVDAALSSIIELERASHVRRVADTVTLS